MNNSYFFYFFISITFGFIACNKSKNSEVESGTLFKLMDPKETGINFENNLQETETLNYYYYDGIYQGAGTAVLDVDKDGLMDVLFVSNQGPEKLYLNKGHFKFEDISKKSGIEGGPEWTTGATIADVNGDGWDDIYISCFLLEDAELRRNRLYINNKDNTFTERAKEFGLADTTYTISATFFDYDLDGDLDMLQVNQPPNIVLRRISSKLWEAGHSCKLYRNDQNHFTDVTKEAGVYTLGYALSAVSADVNNDGYPDLYITVDYKEPDFLFLNMKNGTFRDVAKSAMNHFSLFSMGCDIADYNDDGFLDIFSVDMVAEDRFRNKTNMAGMDIPKFWKNVELGFHYQYMFNSLQLNQGSGSFSEIAQLAGISKTDWSWSVLLADYDNDGAKDLYITNGLLRDVRNRDYQALFERPFDSIKSKLELVKNAPSEKILNYMYHNVGDLKFKNVVDDWGMAQKSFSNGASYVDLDNDGDLDVIVNNIGDKAFVYQNFASSRQGSNYLRLNLVGPKENYRSYGARAVIYYDNGKMQMLELSNARGYMSTSEPFMHFGLGTVSKVDSLIVRWPSGKMLRKTGIKANQTLILKEPDESSETYPQLFQLAGNVLTKEVTQELLGEIHSVENYYDDYKKEILIPHKMSTLGPCLATGDVTGDGNDDIYLGGCAGTSGVLYIQQADGGFLPATSSPWIAHKASEDIDALFFDADGDKDLDLYVASGSNEFAVGSPLYKDRLYINEGGGKFIDGSNRIPALAFSKGVVRAADVDGDGDQDLFIGGRQVPGFYGKSERSALLINEKGTFVDKTNDLCPEMSTAIGMISSATFVDLDKDRDFDLVVVGEWMSPMVFVNEAGKFKNETSKFGLENLRGWWNVIISEDVDGDGDQDLIAGNLGLNTKFKASIEKPFKVFLKDFDDNGSWDIYLGSYDKDGKYYPVRGRQCSSEQMPFIKEKYKTYNEFASHSIDDILDGMKEGAIVKDVTEFHSGIFINEGNTFSFKPFPNIDQIAPIQDVVIYDINKDGFKDLIYGGNYYNREIETTRSDAGVGGILLNDGKGNFNHVPTKQTGLKLNQDLRKLKHVKSGPYDLIIAGFNNANLKAYLLGQL
ncbi:MAG TPA: VCBS repeat-containing protein [Saprospiraceae bacterium]|nr:VCBS repeat-containing protein [Saprospiraceae bacterium]